MGNISHYGPRGRFAGDVLVIDDSQDFADAVANALRRKGMTVQIALDAATARTIARSFEPRVALVDCALPDADGIDLVGELGRTWRDTTFLILSGQVGGVTQKTAQDLRIRAFLNKPVPLAILRQAIDKLLREPRSVALPTDHSWLTLGIGSPSGYTMA